MIFCDFPQIQDVEVLFVALFVIWLMRLFFKSSACTACYACKGSLYLDLYNGRKDIFETLYDLHVQSDSQSEVQESYIFKILVVWLSSTAAM